LILTLFARLPFTLLPKTMISGFSSDDCRHHYVYDAQGNYVGLSNEKILEAESIIRNNRSLVEDEIIINLKLYKVARVEGCLDAREKR